MTAVVFLGALWLSFALGWVARGLHDEHEDDLADDLRARLRALDKISDPRRPW